MIVAWPIIQAFLRANWRAIAVVVGLGILWVWHKSEVNQAWYAGRAALKAEQRAEAQRRDADAKAADDAVRECARDSTCLLRDDGHRRN